MLFASSLVVFVEIKPLPGNYYKKLITNQLLEFTFFSHSMISMFDCVVCQRDETSVKRGSLLLGRACTAATVA